MFDPRTKHASLEHCRLYAAYEIAFTIVDFLAASLFVIGSILFFNEATVYVREHGCFLSGVSSLV